MNRTIRFGGVLSVTFLLTTGRVYAGEHKSLLSPSSKDKGDVASLEHHTEEEGLDHKTIHADEKIAEEYHITLRVNPHHHYIRQYTIGNESTLIVVPRTKRELRGLELFYSEFFHSPIAAWRAMRKKRFDLGRGLTAFATWGQTALLVTQSGVSYIALATGLNSIFKDVVAQILRYPVGIAAMSWTRSDEQAAAAALDYSEDTIHPAAIYLAREWAAHIFKQALDNLEHPYCKCTRNSRFAKWVQKESRYNLAQQIINESYQARVKRISKAHSTQKDAPEAAIAHAIVEEWRPLINTLYECEEDNFERMATEWGSSLDLNVDNRMSRLKEAMSKVRQDLNGIIPPAIYAKAQRTTSQ